ncbi:hypothetical protein RYX36_025975 [Vicia faba]
MGFISFRIVDDRERVFRLNLVWFPCIWDVHIHEGKYPPSIQCAVQFRPCIDIHKGKVKQIVGSTLTNLKVDDGSDPITNFESDKSAAEYAMLYKQDGLKGGHVIMLGADPLSRAASLEALHAYPGILV